MRVLIVGAGIMGLATAWALARRGHAVEVLEQYEVPNPLGSSVDQHRLIRHPYGALDGYTAMIGPAYAAWERLWADLGRRLYVETGTLAVGDDTALAWLDDTRRVLTAQSVPFEELSQDDLARRFPLLDPARTTRVLHLASGGVLLAGRIVEALARHLAQRGVAIRPGTRVAAVDPDAAALRLADGAVLSADRLVVAAGPWTVRLLPGLAERSVPSRQVVAYLAPPPDLAEAWTRMPMVLDIAPDSGFYLVPPVAGTGLKVGDHSFTLRGDPDRDRTPGAGEVAAIHALCRGRLASFDRFTPQGATTCFYDVAPEERFVVEPCGVRGWAMTGFSGHGFKFGALLGEAVADALDGRREPAEVARWAAGIAGEPARAAQPA